MVAFKWLLLGAASFLSVLAQDDPTGDPDVAAAFWAQADSGPTAEGDPPEKRDLLVHMPRNNQPQMKDPYKGSSCCAPYTLPPCETKCNRNNCFRAFLNARDGSDGKHCPKEAFGFCCAWNSADKYCKFWAIKSGYVFKKYPFTKNCKGDKDSIWDALDKINDVCGCTLNHEVTVDTSSAYYGLRYFKKGNPKCH